MENRGLNSLALRIIACLAMTWGTVQVLFKEPTVDWATYMLWFSYTIFAFMLAEGVGQTTDKRKYIRRILVFALISEVPFDLLFCGKFWDMSKQSVMVTLALGCIVLYAADWVKKKFDNIILTLLTLVILGYAATILAYNLNAVMGEFGILFICMFYVCLNVTYTRTLELVFFIAFLFYVEATNYLNVLVNDFYYSFPDASFCLLGAMVTWLYNGKRGPNAMEIKWISYAYHPIMLFVIYLVKNSLNF